MADPLDQYLARHAAPEIALAGELAGTWEAAVVIPAYREPIAFLDGLRPALGPGTLCIVVINRPAGDDGAAVANESLLAGLRAQGRCRPLSGARAWQIEIPEGPTIAAIDRSSPGAELPAKEGVGLARRIGCDLALAVGAAGRLASRWIHTTDADVTLPDDYLAAAAGDRDAVALTYPYWHRTDGLAAPIARAVALYEISLRYYVLGLAAAGSPDAFSAVGSTLALEAGAYARVRGMPPRTAGEDFHLLAKLVKLGPVIRPRCEAIELAGGREPRTPFGTASSTRAIAARIGAGEGFSLYHPESFRLLGELIAAISRDRPIADSRLASAAAGLGLDRMRRAADREPNAAGRRRVMRQWLDALRTLRLIHALEAGGLARQPWRRALVESGLVPAAEASADDEAIRRRLRELEDRALCR
jgi:hypothetical protein